MSLRKAGYESGDEFVDDLTRHIPNSCGHAMRRCNHLLGDIPDDLRARDDGMGIGLSVSKSIIESHRGRLWAETNDGPGASFSFPIPCGQEEQLRPAG